jgi:signal transduction histidine kinase
VESWAASPQHRPWPLPGWLTSSGGRLGDILVVAVVGAAQIAVPVVTAGPPAAGQRHLDALGIALLAVSALALAARRQRPVGVLVVTVVAVALYYLLGYPHGVSFLSLYVAFYTAVVTGHRLIAWVGAGVLAANMWLSSAAGYPVTSAVVAWTTAWLLIVMGGGEVVRLRRAYLGSLRQRAVEAERTRDEEGRRRASEERLHIARELHDLIGHNISLIHVQASVGLHLLERQPDQAAAALTAIKQASKDTLDELRQVIGAVRNAGEESPRRPARGLDDLDALVSATAAAGLDVRLEVSGSPRPVPAALGLAAFRIVQESLTNVRRHAGPAAVAVRLEYGDPDLTVRVEDDGRGPRTARPGRSGGSGLAGMRERAAAVGGRLDAGARPGGGFQVVARLPLGGASPGGTR